MSEMNNMNQQMNYSRGIGTRNNVSVVGRMEYNGVVAEILEYNKLLGSQSPYHAERLWFMEQQNMKVKVLDQVLLLERMM